MYFGYINWVSLLFPGQIERPLAVLKITSNHTVPSFIDSFCVCLSLTLFFLHCIFVLHLALSPLNLAGVCCIFHLNHLNDTGWPIYSYICLYQHVIIASNVIFFVETPKTLYSIRIKEICFVFFSSFFCCLMLNYKRHQIERRNIMRSKWTKNVPFFKKRIKRAAMVKKRQVMSSSQNCFNLNVSWMNVFQTSWYATEPPAFNTWE